MLKLRAYQGALFVLWLANSSSAADIPAADPSTIAPTESSAKQIETIREQTPSIPQPNVIYYDAIEDGEIVDGGILPVNDTNPLEAAVKLQSAAPAPAYNSETILNNGPTENRIDLVLLGDGYTEQELANYINHANNMVNGFFNEGVLNNYQSYFNVHRVDVISNESGVDNDPNGILRDTALDMTYYCSNIARLLCVSVAKAIEAASNAPETDQILALANSTTYGGAGYASADLGTVAGNNGSALEVAIHEFGHSFANLADEYSYGGPETYTGPELVAANVSIYEKSEMQANESKWYRWFDATGVDTFEGGNYSVYGVFRPTADSKMRNLGQPFGPINDEAFIIKIYQTVSPIDSATPSGNVTRGTLVNVTPTQPLDHALTIQWWVDGELAEETGEAFDTNTLSDGPHTLAVRVTDNTEKVRDETARQQWMTAERIWTVLDNNNPLADLSIALSSNSFLGWATPFQFWRTGEIGNISFKVTLNNMGPNTAEQIQVAIPVPEAVNFSGFTAENGSCILNTENVTCELDSLASGAEEKITLNFTTLSSEVFDFEVSIASNTPDPEANNNNSAARFGGAFNFGIAFSLLMIGYLRKRYY